MDLYFAYNSHSAQYIFCLPICRLEIMIMPTCQALSEAYSCIKNANCWRWKSCWLNIVLGGCGKYERGGCVGSFARASQRKKPHFARPADVPGLSLCFCVCKCPLFPVPSTESPPERCGQRRSMPSGVTEKNPTMEPAATTPFRVTVSVSPHLSDCYGILMIITGFCQKGEELAHPERRGGVRESSWLLIFK